jgi:hypothetical protein
MLRLRLTQNCALSIGVVLLLGVSTVCLAQESRGSITGKVVDPQNAVVPGASVVVTNTATNVSGHATTNQTGYFEVDFLVVGPYSVSVESAGFKKFVQTGITLDTGDRLALDLKLEIGQTSQSVQVTADAPLLDTATSAQGRVLNTRDMAQLPYTTMNPFALQAMAAGMIFTGSETPDNNRALDHAATASFASGGLGAALNEFLLDGNPVTGTNGGRAGFVPNAEAVDEVRIETDPYNASMGHAVGVFISATIKSGTNALHGAGYWQFQQFRWNATPDFTRLNYQAGLANGTVAKGTPEQASGRVTQPGFGIGGPVYIPHVFNGKNKLFFYIAYSKLVSIAPPNSTPIYTVPTVPQRSGDFSALLVGTTNPSQYIIYDPRTAATVSGHVTRTPFPNNILPASVMNNPITKFYSQLYPLPNNPTQMAADGTNNFYDGGQPDNDWFPDFINRYDYNINQRQHLSGKWYFNSRLSDQYDWAHGTPLKGVESNGLYRPTRGGSLDYLFTINANNVLDIPFSITQYSEGDKKPIVLNYTAASVGLPAYIDQKAAAQDCLPWINIAGVADAASTSFVGAQGLNQRGTTEQLAAKMTTVKGRHTFTYGYEERRYHYGSVNPLGNATGYYQFTNSYDRQADNTTTASSTGLPYASFLMGLPSSIGLDTNDTGYWTTRYHTAYIQDDFRVTSKLRIGFGLRFEREGGITERFNRGVEGMYNFGAVPPYGTAVQNAYSTMLSSPANASNAAVQTLAQAMPASAFQVVGGVSYLGQQYSNWTQGTNRFLPNVSVVYEINSKTVLRAGTGWHSDTFNSMNSRPGQNGYSQATNTILTNDNGLTYCCAVNNGSIAASGMGAANPMMNPFPVLASGSRWVMPAGNSLGAGQLDGQGFTYYPRNYSPTWEQRYSIGIQRELRGNHRIEASYNGGYANLPMTKNLSPLPAKYWNFSDSYSAATDNAMKATVPNPFLAALPAIQASNPALYNYLSNVGMFTGTTLAVQQLLRAYPNAGFGLSENGGFRAKDVDNEIRVIYRKRWSHGFQSQVQYAHMWGRQQWLPNQFDPEPAWQLNSNIRPNRLVWSNVVELPFGKGHQWLQKGPAAYIVGGWQISWVYTYQTGPLISMGNLFYYGSVDQVVQALNHDNIHNQNIHLWYDPAAVWTSSSSAPPASFVGFEGRSAVQPGTYQARVFPQYIDSLRSDGIRDWDAKLLRQFQIHESIAFTVSCDFLNLTNHTQFGAPNMTVTSSAFGGLTSQSNAGRILQFATRFQF